MARPCRHDTVNFTRILTDEQRAILLAAGDGDLTVGFNECLALWVAIHPLATAYVPKLQESVVTSYMDEDQR
jgi:hypothetical protein